MRKQWNFLNHLQQLHSLLSLDPLLLQFEEEALHGVGKSRLRGYEIVHVRVIVSPLRVG